MPEAYDLKSLKDIFYQATKILIWFKTIQMNVVQSSHLSIERKI